MTDADAIATGVLELRRLALTERNRGYRIQRQAAIHRAPALSERDLNRKREAANAAFAHAARLDLAADILTNADTDRGTDE